MPSSSLPKLSYVLLSHNREKYIRGAIESAFAQDYEGELEYIFSDDCSTDRTFEIIKECVAAYKGNRRVVVTQTPKNLRLADHTNHAIKFVQSDWIIRADDDDLSSCSRCSIIGSAIARNPDVKFVATSYVNYTLAETEAIQNESMQRIVDISKETLRSIYDDKMPTPDFAFNYYFKAWHIDIYRKFGILPPHADYVDDLICYYRGSVLGRALYIESRPLVFARTDSGNQSYGGVNKNNRGTNAIISYELFLQKYYNQSVSPMLETKKQILDYVDTHYTEGEKKCASKFLDSFQASVKEVEDMTIYWQKGFIYRWKTLRRYNRNMNLFLILRCLPLPLFAKSLYLARKIKLLFK